MSISVVIGSFFVVLCAEVRLEPAKICLTSGWSVGSSTAASWCAHERKWTASSIGALVLAD
ncbi:MAG: hypothetical protein MJE68_17575 [Proteobacteria bacterium]|nr:hypothetical protein [Pseudomonadota bacterium]